MSDEGAAASPTAERLIGNAPTAVLRKSKTTTPKASLKIMFRISRSDLVLNWCYCDSSDPLRMRVSTR
jgi:hypothetical protein